MSIQMIFILCGMFIIPDVFTAAKSIEEYLGLDENDNVRANDESLEEIIEEPLSIEEIETKSLVPCQANVIYVKPLQCGSYPYVITLNGSSDTEFVQLNKCIGYVSPNYDCVAVNSTTVWVKFPGFKKDKCFKPLSNETKCEPQCKCQTKPGCDCASKKYFV